MNDGIGEGKTGRTTRTSPASSTRDTHHKQVEMLASVIGEEELSKVDKKYLEFGQQFEDTYIRQGIDEERSIYDSMERGWQLLSVLPRAELVRVKEEQIDKYLPKVLEE